MLNKIKQKLVNREYNEFQKILDNFIIKSKLTIPVFFVLLFFVFEITFTFWNFLANFLDIFFSYIFNLTWIQNTFVSAIYWWIVGVFIYIPNVFILYFFLYLFEDSWLLPRISYVFDKYLRRIWLTWTWFLSMFMWFGCTVPAIMSTKSITNRKEKILTIMMLPFISCSAKLPVFVLIISAFIPWYLQSVVLISLYFLWIIFWLVSNYFLRIFLKHKNRRFIINLPHYRIPKFKNILFKIILVLKEFLVKISVFIIPFSIILTLAFTYPSWEKIENTYWAKLWQTIWVVFKPLWFNDKMSISVISWLVWKEIIVSTLWSLYYLDDSSDTDRLVKKIQNDKTINYKNAISFLLFILLYTACMWAVFTARTELWNKWGFIFFIYPILFAWIMSFIVYNFMIYLF
jgi:ferrous iron transport protein B